MAPVGKHSNSVVEFNSRARHLAELLVVAMAVAFAVPAFAQIPITNQCPGPQVLSKSGNYVLTTDSCGIVISASNVRLNTAAHGVSTILTALVIDDGLSNIRIDGGGGLSGGTGVIIGASRNIMLNNLSISGNVSYTTGIAVQLNGAKGVAVTNSKIESGGCPASGPAISGTVNNGLFSHNTILSFGCGTNGGIRVDGANIVIRDNIINSQNHLVPFYAISETSGTVITGNAITLTPPADGVARQMVGIDLTGDSNLVNGNTIQGDANANSYGIFAATGAIGNTIIGNTAKGNQYDLFESNGPPCVNIWRHNKFQTSGGAVACIK
jgi:hypothetical protein